MKKLLYYLTILPPIYKAIVNLILTIKDLNKIPTIEEINEEQEKLEKKGK